MTGKPYCPYIPDNGEFTVVKTTTNSSLITNKMAKLIPHAENSEQHPE
jgi:hypothetical protein